jgi:hypothetical protein
MSKRQNAKCYGAEDEQKFSYTVAYLRSDLNAWKRCRKQSDTETVNEFRTLFRRQVDRLEEMAEIGLVTPTSLRLIALARKYLADM